MTLGERIRHQREQLSLTQDQVAARAGISKPYLSNIETGRAKNPPTDAVLERLEEALGFEGGALRWLAHLHRTPADVRAEKESAEAEAEKLRAILRNLIQGRQEGDEAAVQSMLEGVRLRDVPPEPTAVPWSAGRAVPLINSVVAGYPANFTDLDYPAGVAEEYVRLPELDDPQAFAARVVGDSMAPVYHEGDVVVFAPNHPATSGMDCFVRFAESHDTTFKRFYLDDDGLLRLQPLNPAYPSRRCEREEIDGLWPAAYRIERVNRPAST